MIDIELVAGRVPADRMTSYTGKRMSELTGADVTYDPAAYTPSAWCFVLGQKLGSARERGDDASAKAIEEALYAASSEEGLAELKRKHSAHLDAASLHKLGLVPSHAAGLTKVAEVRSWYRKAKLARCSLRGLPPRRASGRAPRGRRLAVASGSRGSPRLPAGDDPPGERPPPLGRLLRALARLLGRRT